MSEFHLWEYSLDKYAQAVEVLRYFMGFHFIEGKIKDLNIHIFHFYLPGHVLNIDA
jgi:hypothetical protein